MSPNPKTLERVRVVEIPEKLEFLLEPWAVKCAVGGRGSSKSWTMAKLLLERGRKNKELILCTREFQNSIADSVIKLLSDLISESPELSEFYEVQKTEIIGKNGTRFFFAGIRTNPRSIKSAEGITICWVEEAENVSKVSWDLLEPTIRREGSEIWISFNPDYSTDETYQRWVVDPPSYCKTVKVNWRDNPWFNQKLRTQMIECKRKSHADYLHIWEGVPKDQAGTTKLKLAWLQPWPAREWTGFNIYITVDPANSKGKKSDWTVMTVWALGPDGNYYIIKWIRDKFNTLERVLKVFDLVDQYRPIRTGWEHTGMSGDIDVIKYIQEQRNYRFNIVPIKPKTGVPKEARIEAALLPMASENRLYIPDTMIVTTLDNRTMDLVQEFKREWQVFPHADGDLVHDDMLDSSAMIKAEEMQAVHPNVRKNEIVRPPKKNYNPLEY